jgi:FkbM family methyltransferase
VLAFEPAPFIWERAQRNIELNQWHTRCQVRRMAVSDFKGRAMFHIPHHLPFPCSASLSPDGFRGLAGETIEVAVKTADAAGGARVDPVKIDVENFEHKVLEGMHGLLRSFGPAIVLECNADGPYTAISDVLKPRWVTASTSCVSNRQLRAPSLPDLSGRFRNYL